MPHILSCLQDKVALYEYTKGVKNKVCPVRAAATAEADAAARECRGSPEALRTLFVLPQTSKTAMGVVQYPGDLGSGGDL